MNVRPFTYGNIFIIGLGFFSISVVWQLYNAFMPLMLGEFIQSKALRGAIMGLDNLANIFLIPLIGAWSDRIVSPVGKRLPFLLAGMPLAALFLFAMPHYLDLWTLILIDIGFLLAMTLFRAPTISLMPDMTPPNKRSPANGIINFMGGVGALFTLFVLARLYDLNRPLPFYLGGLILLAVLAALFFHLRNRPAPYAGTELADDAANGTTGLVRGLQELVSSRDRSLLFVLLAIFFWFLGLSGVEAQFTTYGVEYMQLTEGQAAKTIGFFSLTFILFAIPSGFIGKSIGRVRTIRVGIIGIILMFVAMILLEDLAMIRLVLLAGGMFWAFINIHSYPLVVGFTDGARIGLFTGLYYLFSSIAQTVGPVLLGLFMDLFGYPSLFIGSAIFMVLALLSMSRVKEPAPLSKDPPLASEA